MKKEKTETKRYDQRLEVSLKLFSILLIGLFIMLGLILTLDFEANMDCRFDNIRLVDVSPAPCYGDFSSYQCPVPEDMNCNFDGKIPFVILKMWG